MKNFHWLAWATLAVIALACYADQDLASRPLHDLWTATWIAVGGTIGGLLIGLAFNAVLAAVILGPFYLYDAYMKHRAKRVAEGQAR
jgi:hypothetical protein